MKTSDFYYDLPEELIAQDPLEDRSSSRLMTVDKETGKIGHHVFSEIIDYLNEGDCLVINDTKVIPARLIGAKEETGAKIEVLLLKRGADDVCETNPRSRFCLTTGFHERFPHIIRSSFQRGKRSS